MRPPGWTILAALCWLPLAQAEAPHARRRAEAQASVQQLLAGRSVPSAISRLAYLGEEDFAASELARLIHTPDERQRRDVALGLSQLAGPPQLGALQALARDRDGAIRMAAATGLGRAGAVAVPSLWTLLEDRTLGVRRAAALALGRVGGPATGGRLIESARREAEPEVRAAILVAVGEVGAKQQRRALVGFLDSGSEGTRLAAARALCLLGAREGLSFVRERLGRGDPYERRAVLELLTEVPGKSVVPLLRPLLEDGDPAVAAAAARLLAHAGEPSARAWLVLAAERAVPGERGPYLRELERLGVTEAERGAVLRKAGLR